MPWNLLLLPLLGGYVYLHRVDRQKFRFQRADGYRLLLATALTAFWLAAASRLIVALIAAMPFGPQVESAWSRLVSFEYSGTAFGSLLLGYIAAWFANALNKGDPWEQALDQVGDRLISLFYHAVWSERPLYITLDNRKVYVAYVLMAPNLERPDQTHVVLLPVWSGYRRSEELTTHFTTFYDEVFLRDDVDPSGFSLVIPVQRIASAHYFDIDTYRQYFSVGGRPGDPVANRSGDPPLDPYIADEFE